MINRNFALLWAGQGFSLIGDQVFDTTLVVWIAAILARGQSYAPLAVSGVLVAATVPVLVVGPAAGVFVDRWDKRRTLIVMDVVRAVLILGLVLLDVFGHLPGPALLAAVYVTVFAAAVAAQFFNPARLALIGDIVPADQQTRASSLSQVTLSISNVVGPPLAVPLLFGLGVDWALLVNAASFAISFLAVLAVQAPASARSGSPGQLPSFWRELAAGLRFSVHNPTISTILVSSAIVMFGAGSVNALTVFFMEQNLHVSATLYGYTGAAFGAGILAGAIVLGGTAARIGVHRLFAGALLWLGAVLVVFAWTSSFLLALPLVFLFGIGQAAVSVAVAPLVLGAAPRELIGRVFSVFNPLTNLAATASIVIAGALASTLLLGRIDLIFSAAGVLILLGGLYAALRFARLG